MEVRQNVPFTAFTGTQLPNTSMFNSMMASLMEDASTKPTAFPTVIQATSTAVASITSIATNSAATPRIPVPASALSSSSSQTDTTSSPSSTSTSRSASITTVPQATGAPSNSNGALPISQSCNSISCSPGLQAAVAVPIAVVALLVIGLSVFLAKRRRRSRRTVGGASEKPQKNWTRHLRMFGFDTEILAGGRYSSSNSTRSGDSQQDMTRALPRDTPSMRSIDDAAPPYRAVADQGSNTSVAQNRTSLIATDVASPAIPPRTTSRATDPPPYVSATTRTEDTPVVSSNQNPFSDPVLAGPIEPSPFRDPSEQGSIQSRPTISRNSSVHTGVNSENQSVMGESEAGSIHEAQVGRHISIASSGRVTHIRHSSHSPPDHTPPSTD